MQYADLGEFYYGLAFLSTSPYAEQDQGMIVLFFHLVDCILTQTFIGGHQFSWAILPHEGHFLKSDVPMAAYLL